MNLEPINQTKLIGLYSEFNELVNLHKKEKLPNKILLSGKKGSGKCTLAYHLINYVLSIDELNPYNQDHFTIDNENKSYRLILSGACPNFHLIDILEDKKTIDINQIRELLLVLNKSILNSKPRFVLIDNIQFLNINSINALLKSLEEPTHNTYFILINNNKKILNTLKSRCLNFKISLSNKKSIEITNSLIEGDLFELLNVDFINYYNTPGNYLNLINFSKENDIDLKKNNLKTFFELIINGNYYKKKTSIRDMLFDYLELFCSKKIDVTNNDLINYYSKFLKKIYNTKKFNLDEESLFIEFESNLLNE